jgi:hypothetical protein
MLCVAASSSSGGVTIPLTFDKAAIPNYATHFSIHNNVVTKVSGPAGWATVRSNQTYSSGIHYIEFIFPSVITTSHHMVGIVESTANINQAIHIGQLNAHGIGLQGNGTHLYFSATNHAATGTPITAVTSKIIFILDFDKKEISVTHNGTHFPLPAAAQLLGSSSTWHAAVALHTPGETVVVHEINANKANVPVDIDDDYFEPTGWLDENEKIIIINELKSFKDFPKINIVLLVTNEGK